MEREKEMEGEVEEVVESEEKKAKRLLYCSLCKVAVNSASQLQAHNSGENEALLTCLCTGVCHHHVATSPSF